MKYPLAHEEDLFEIFPTPEYLPDGKTLNPRQSRVVRFDSIAFRNFIIF